MSSYPRADLALARRLERAEARASAEFVEARAQHEPDSGAEWVDVAGAYAMYDGVDSPLTQSFGLGIFEEPSDAALEALESFFFDHGAEVAHEVCPLIDEDLLGRLSGRGYQPIELSNVLYRPIDVDVRLRTPGTDAIVARPVTFEETHLWARTFAHGWSDVAPELYDYLLGLAPINAIRPATSLFVAEKGDQLIAAGGLSLFDNVALLAGASTAPEHRRQGAQLALLEDRLRFAAERGCDLALVVTRPGSASQRNAERQGFRIAYTRIKWYLATD